ncbi:hypothetical protein IW261DRAFT_147012 [Armillaria novae-zelandiae]|uniref:Uncharacterized protein n=1 Tax=Armillaria novae-zelandiae TaxID=153914 RepID=A0AA39UHY3_9AGAR|nr:hypothetical protein IW261DRAFT_147012 [Armillaria novae-zelandiae]
MCYSYGCRGRTMYLQPWLFIPSVIGPSVLYRAFLAGLLVLLFSAFRCCHLHNFPRISQKQRASLPDPNDAFVTYQERTDRIINAFWNFYLSQWSNLMPPPSRHYVRLRDTWTMTKASFTCNPTAMKKKARLEIGPGLSCDGCAYSAPMCKDFQSSC